MFGNGMQGKIGKLATQDLKFQMWCSIKDVVNYLECCDINTQNALQYMYKNVSHFIVTQGYQSVNSRNIDNDGLTKDWLH